MIRPIEGLAGNAIGFEAVGTVTADDYKTTIEPAMRTTIAENDEFRLVYILGDEFEGFTGGAMWEDAKEVAHVTKAKRTALVTDHALYRDGFRAFAWMMPGQAKVFPVSETEAAKAWISE